MCCVCVCVCRVCGRKRRLAEAEIAAAAVAAAAVAAAAMAEVLGLRWRRKAREGGECWGRGRCGGLGGGDECVGVCACGV